MSTKTLGKYLIMVVAILCIKPVFAQTWGAVGLVGFSDSIAQFPSIAIEGSGSPYVAYMDWGNAQKATVKKFNGSSWVNVGVEGFSSGSADPSIAIDGSGTPYVVFSDGGIPNYGAATVMKFYGSSWSIVGSAGFSAGGAGSTCIAIDGSGTPFVAYIDDVYGLKVTVKKFNGSSWVTVGTPGFSTGAADGLSLAIDGSGVPYVAYPDESTPPEKATVMKFNGSSWVVVGSIGFSDSTITHPSIAIDGSSTPYIAFTDGGYSQKATVMKFTGTTWATVGTAGFSPGAALSPALAIDGSGSPFVVFEDNTIAKSTVMKFNGTSWVIEGTPGFSAGLVANTGIAIDGGGTPYVVYQDFANSQKATVMKLMSSTAVNRVNADYDIKLFPNPNQGAFMLNIASANNEPIEVAIFNIYGVRLKELNAFTNIMTPIFLNSCPGTYFVYLTSKSQTLIKQITIQ